MRGRTPSGHRLRSFSCASSRHSHGFRMPFGMLDRRTFLVALAGVAGGVLGRRSSMTVMRQDCAMLKQMHGSSVPVRRAGRSSRLNRPHSPMATTSGGAARRRSSSMICASHQAGRVRMDAGRGVQQPRVTPCQGNRALDDRVAVRVECCVCEVRPNVDHGSAVYHAACPSITGNGLPELIPTEPANLCGSFYRFCALGTDF